MVADFSKPTEDSDYLVEPSEIRANIAAVSKMDYTNALNVEVGAIRYNSSTARLEKYNGATWDTVPVGALKLANNEAIVARNAANSADIPILFVDPSNYTTLSGLAGGSLGFAKSGIWKWFISGADNLLPQDDNAYTLGDAAHRVKEIHAGDIKTLAVYAHDAGTVTIPSSAPTVNSRFMRWSYFGSGAMFAAKLDVTFGASDCDWMSYSLPAALSGATAGGGGGGCDLITGTAIEFGWYLHTTGPVLMLRARAQFKAATRYCVYFGGFIL